MTLRPADFNSRPAHTLHRARQRDDVSHVVLAGGWVRTGHEGFARKALGGPEVLSPFQVVVGARHGGILATRVG
jgi:hypothetical protein